MSLADSTLPRDRRSIVAARSASDLKRLRAILQAHSPGLARYLARVGVPLAELDDAMQETFVIVAAKLATVPVGSERAYLFATALRVASNARRGQRRRDRTRDTLLLLPPDSLESAGSDLVEELHARSLLEDALDELPTDSRVVFVLSELHEMPLAHIAARLGLPGGTVASKLRRARRKFDDWKDRAVAAAAFDDARPKAPPSLAPSVASESDRRPEVMSWWVSRGEVDALGALVGVYQRMHPNAGVVRAGAAIAKDHMRRRMSGSTPPDTFQINGGGDLSIWTRRGPARERLEPLDSLFDTEGWRRAFPSDVLDLVTHAGRLYAVPVDIHRTNALFYNRALFAEHGFAPPSTLEEMHALADMFRARGVVPFALGYRHPWTLTMLAFENVLVAVAGGDSYRSLFSGDLRRGEGHLRTALAHVARILDYANADAAKLTWDGAVERVRTGRAAMTIMGDWAKGYLMNAGASAERDFGQVAAPGTGGTFVFCTDAFGVPQSASQRASAIDLLKVFGSREGQDAFNPLKGSIPARIDADLSRYDPLARATAESFRTSARFPSLSGLTPGAFKRTLESSMALFAKSRDPEVVVTTIRAHLAR